MINHSEGPYLDPPAPLPATPIRIPTPSQTELANGLTLLVVEDHRLPLVSYRLAFRSGDANDPVEFPGLTDMMASLLNEGTETRTSRQIAEEVDRLGATLYAAAGSDSTTVAASALTMFSIDVLELMADITLHPSFPENEVELSKQNTKESLKQQRAQPSFLANEMLSRVMFGDHPYSVIAPTPESIDATSRERLIEFHRTMFVPNNAFLIVVGDVQRDAMVEKIDRLFGGWQRRAIEQPEFPAPPSRKSRVGYLVDRPGSAQSNIVIANPAITRTSPDYFPMAVMHTVLGATASSRLFMNLREAKGYTYGAYSNLDARRLAGTFRATAEVRTPVTGDSLREFFYELERIRSEAVSKTEINDAKSYLTGAFPLRLETQEGLTDQLTQIKMLGLPDDYLQTYRDRVQSVTIEQVKQVAEKYIKPDEAAVVIVGDGAEVAPQLRPFTGTIEFYNTAGKRTPAPAPASPTAAEAWLGRWVIEIATPMGQNIPAVLTFSRSESAVVGKIESEMGGGTLAGIRIDGSELSAGLAFEMDEQTLAADLNASADSGRISGTFAMEGAPPLSFTGARED